MHLRFQDTDHTEMRNHRDPLGICLCGDLREGCAHARLKLAEALPSARAQLWIPRAHAGELLGEALRDICVRKSTPGTYVALAKARERWIPLPLPALFGVPRQLGMARDPHLEPSYFQCRDGRDPLRAAG